MFLDSREAMRVHDVPPIIHEEPHKQKKLKLDVSQRLTSNNDRLISNNIPRQPFHTIPKRGSSSYVDSKFQTTGITVVHLEIRRKPPDATSKR